MDRLDVTLLTPMMPRQPERQNQIAELRRGDSADDVKVASPVVEPLSAEDVDDAVRKLNDFIQVVRRDLQFTVDENSGRTIITVLDSETEEVVRQIPPERLVAAAENIERLQGLLFEAEA